MASLRKKLSMALGLNGEGSSSTSKASSMDRRRKSIDSGYHSMIAKSTYESQKRDSHLATFVTSSTESSPERSPRKLHKAISSTFSGAMQAFSNTVRATTSYIYPTPGEPELPWSEWAECETPKKESRRSSIMSSVRSRKQKSTPRVSGAKNESQELQSSPGPVTQDRSPALDVEIPNPSLSHESLVKVLVSNGSQLLTGVKLPPGSKNLWPGPTRLTFEQASANAKRNIPHNLLSKIDDPYVEQGGRGQHDLSITSSSEFDLELNPPETNKRYMSDDKGYLSEAESNAETPEADGPTPATPSERTSPFRMSPMLPGSEPSKVETLDGAAEKTASLEPPNRRFGRRTSSLEDGLYTLSLQHEPATTAIPRSLNRRLPSDVYDADAETLESSMGSRSAWERHRADREKRYLQIIDMAPDTESDEDLGPELELKRSPSRVPMHSAEEMVQGTFNTGRPGFPAGDLRYPVEAIERPAFPVDDLTLAVDAVEGQAIPAGDLAYAVEAIDRPSITTFEPLETVFQQRPMLRLSDTADEPEKLEIPDPLALPQSHMEPSSSPIGELTSSRKELSSSPESSQVENPPATKSAVTTMRLTEKDRMTAEAGNVEDRCIHELSSESTTVYAQALPEHQSHEAPQDCYRAGPKAGGFVDTNFPSSSSPLRDDACGAGLRAADTSMPIRSPDALQTKPVLHNLNEGEFHAFHNFPQLKETSHSSSRGKLEAELTLPKQRSPNGTPFEQSRTVSAFSDDTDDSCVITTNSPSGNVPPPFPSLPGRSEPARRIPNALDTLATDPDEEIRISGPANAGIGPSLRLTCDDTGKESNEAGLKSLSLTASEGSDLPKVRAQAASLEQHGFQSPSSGTTSSICSRSNTNTPSETFNAAKLPSFGSPSLIGSKKSRRKQKKSSSGVGNHSSANRTINATSLDLEPDFSLATLEPSKESASSETQTSLSGNSRVLKGNVEEPSQNCQTGKETGGSRNQFSPAEVAESVSDSVRRWDSVTTSNSSNRSPGGEGQMPATLTFSPPRLKLPRARNEASSNEVRENAEYAIADYMSRHEPELSIKHFTSTSSLLTLDGNGILDDTSYTGHQLDSVLQETPPSHYRQRLDNNLQQDNDEKAAHSVSGEEIRGRDSDLYKGASRTPDQKKKHGRPPPEVEKKFAVQKELERKADRACSRLAGKLKARAPGDDHVREGDAPLKDGRPLWRP